MDNGVETYPPCGNKQGNKMSKKSIKGLTFWIAFGSYGGFYIDRQGFCLGWASVKIMPIDVENVLEMLMDENSKLKARLDSKVG